MLLKDRVAVVTGGGRGIGAGIARYFAKEGAQVVVADRSADSAAAVAAEIVASGGLALSVPTDIADPAAIAGLFAEAERRFGRTDVLVNNAAMAPPRAHLLELGPDAWDQALAINLTGMMLCSQAAARSMAVRRWGRIVNILAIQAWLPLPRNSAYVASKGGAEALTRGMAVDLAPLGIIVNGIAPGLVYVEGDTPPPERDAASPNLLGRLGRPDEIAALAAFLASDACTYVVGEIVRCDGGRLLSRRGDPDWLG